MTLPYHEEILGVLRKLANPKRGEAIRRDRGSELEYLGIRTPALRRAVKEGFSFYDLPEEKVLEIWNELWMRSPYGEVLFAALEYYGPRVRKRVGPELWPVMKGWSRRIENWAHADFLSGIYSRILEKYPGAKRIVMVQMQSTTTALSYALAVAHPSRQDCVVLWPA